MAVLLPVTQAEVAVNLNRYLNLLSRKKIYPLYQYRLLDVREPSVMSLRLNDQLCSRIVCIEAPGPDSIHPYILKACAQTLCMLFHQSLTSGDLPCDWERAHVISVFKKGSRFKASNYI